MKLFLSLVFFSFVHAQVSFAVVDTKNPNYGSHSQTVFGDDMDDDMDDDLETQTSDQLTGVMPAATQEPQWNCMPEPGIAHPTEELCWSNTKYEIDFVAAKQYCNGLSAKNNEGIFTSVTLPTREQLRKWYGEPCGGKYSDKNGDPNELIVDPDGNSTFKPLPQFLECRPFLWSLESDNEKAWGFQTALDPLFTPPGGSFSLRSKSKLEAVQCVYTHKLTLVTSPEAKMPPLASPMTADTKTAPSDSLANDTKTESLGSLATDPAASAGPQADAKTAPATSLAAPAAVGVILAPSDTSEGGSKK